MRQPLLNMGSTLTHKHHLHHKLDGCNILLYHMLHLLIPQMITNVCSPWSPKCSTLFHTLRARPRLCEAASFRAPQWPPPSEGPQSHGLYWHISQPTCRVKLHLKLSVVMWVPLVNYHPFTNGFSQGFSNIETIQRAWGTPWLWKAPHAKLNQSRSLSDTFS